MLPADQLTELAQALLDSSDFCKEYRHNYSEYGLNRRNEIVRTLDDLGFDKPNIEDREQLRRYFDELWQLPMAQYRTESADWSQIGTVYFEIGSKLPNRDSGPWRTDPFSLPLPITPKETIMNNAATSAVMCPIALGAAGQLDAQPQSFLMAVAIGAACDFLTPIGHQCNTLVMGPGGYRFGDYWKLGLPLSFIVVAVATPMIVMVWM